MKTTEQLQIHEQQRSFDPLASVRMAQSDIFEHGRVLPETWRRITDEELSYLSEGVDRAARTEFVLKRHGNDLVYFSGGEWLPYQSMLATGQRVAREEAKKDPRKKFMSEMADDDFYIGYQMGKLLPGQKLSWFSSYRQEQEDANGRQFMISNGFNPERKLAFLYQAECDVDGNVVLATQTVDNSNVDALSAAVEAAQDDSSIDLDDMTSIYDFELSKNNPNGKYYAGRLNGKLGENAWSEILEQENLVRYLLNGIEQIARSDRSIAELEVMAKKHIYGVWSAFKSRLDGDDSFRSRPEYEDARLSDKCVAMEVEHYFNRFVTEGRVLVGCGGGISVLRGEDSVMKAESGDVFSAIFGNKKNEKLVWKKGVCRVDNCPTQPGKTEVAQCSVCRGCQKWFDRGRDPSKIYRGLRSAQKTAVTVKKEKSHKQTFISKSLESNKKEAVLAA